MTRKNPAGRDQNPDQGRPTFGTQMAAFGNSSESAKRPADAAALAATVTGHSTDRDLPAHGTRFAAPIHQQADHSRQMRKDLPSQASFEAVSQTRRADPAMLQHLIAEEAGQTPQQPQASRVRSITESEKTLILNQRAGDGQPIGKSTWDLRIHRRDVQGQISGIVNPIPAKGETATGLQSALAVDDDAPEYDILGELGAGNMGIVYRARQLSLNRELAIKTLKPNSKQAQHDQAMFVSEAVVTANLVHPNIVPIHDLGRTHDGKLFYSMKRVTGVSWNKVLRERSQEENLDIYLKLCDAVAYAHSRGVINRDLKPENVIVGDYGEVVVLDWGLAITTERFEKRRSVVVDFRGGAGTPVYMAPELLDEDLSRVGPHSDIYLLGAILYEILEGFPPHLLHNIWHITDPGEQFDAVYRAVMYNEIEQNVVHQGELMRIALKAMSTQPEDRFPTVEALQEAIREYRITGRAEELMKSIDSQHTGDYTAYQSAVALYSEALLKWPENRRAIVGDRNARLAYAKLAQKKGDIDLGLQVVSSHSDPAFLPVIAKLKKTRLIRKIVRGTWGVMTVAAVSLLMVSLLAYSKLVAANGELADVREKVNVEKLKAEDATHSAEIATAAASKATLDAEIAIKQGEKAKLDARLEVEKAAQIAALAKSEAEEASRQASKSKEEAQVAEAAATRAAAEARTAVDEAETAKVEAAAARAEAEKALSEKFQSENEGFTKKIEAAEQLGDFDSVIRFAEEALNKAAANPLLKQKEVSLKKTIDEAIRNGGNARIQLKDSPNSASISADGTTVVVYYGGREKSVSVYRNENGLHGSSPEPLRIPITLKGSAKVTVSDDGRCFCLTAGSEKQLWQLQQDHYQQVNLNPAQGTASFSIGWTFFSPDSRRVYFVGSDKQATVEIYSLESGAARRLLQQPLGNAAKDFRIRDVVLLPDQTALIAQFVSEPCFEYRISWSSDGIPSFDHLAKSAPQLKPFKIDGLSQSPDQPEKLFVDSDSKRLAMTYSDKVVFLHRIPDAPPNQFSFANPSESSASYEMLKATYKVIDVQFSENRKRIATGHGNRYVQLWDLDGQNYQASPSKGLFKHSPKRGGIAACLRGHAKEVEALRFAAGDADRLLTVSADASIRTWQISTYYDLTRQMQEIRKVFELEPDSTAALIPLKRSPLTAAVSPERTRGRSSYTDASKLLRSAAYIPVAGPAAQPPADRQTHQITQGQAIYSARFSPDAKRFLIGADDLAAHAFDSETGKEIMTASMLGRKDLLFDPSRNMFLEGHVSEISAIRFIPPKGDLLLSADYFGSISVWDAVPDDNGAGFERSRLLSEYSFSEFAVSADGTLILAGGATTTNPQGDIKDAELLHKGVLWRTEDVLQSTSPAPFREFRDKHPGFAITAVALSPASKRAITAGRRGKMVVWNIEDNSVVAEADGQHNRDQVSGIFFESESTFVSSGYDGKVFRSTISGNEITAEPIKRSGDANNRQDPDFIVRLRPSPDLSRFATSEVSRLKGSKSGELNFTIWSADGTRSLLSQPIAIPDKDKDLAFRHDVSWSPDGRELMLIHNGVIAIFETTDWKLLRKFEIARTEGEKLDPGSSYNLRGASPIRGAFAPSADGQSDRIATFDGRVMHMWTLPQDGGRGEHVAEFRSHARYAVTASYSSNEKYVATASETLRLFDADEQSPNHGSTMYRLPVGAPHNSPLADVAFSPVTADLRLATIDHQGILALWLWDPASPKLLTHLCDPVPNPFGPPDWMPELEAGNVVAWNPDGKSLATLQSGVISLWTLNNNTPERIELPLPEGLQCRFNQLHYSEQHPWLAAGGVAWNEDNGRMLSFAAIWDISDQAPRIIATIDNPDQVHLVETLGIQRKGITAIAIDDKRNEVITGGIDSRLIRWPLVLSTDGSVRSLNRVIGDMKLDNGTAAAPEPHTAVITAVDVSPVGQILTADEKGHVVLWPASTN
ncbi:MAG: protein kinase [Planctomycetaceae bacterium]|nr:protein kinase [Planctomycetaceae bacterium]